MSRETGTSHSQQLAAVKGPNQDIESLQTELAAVLASVLERRQAIKRYLGSDEAAEEEILHITALFTAASRKAIANQLLRAWKADETPVALVVEKRPTFPDMEFSTGVGMPTPVRKK